MAKSEKTKGEQLQEQLLLKPENAGLTLTDEQIEQAFEFCEGYKVFLDDAKTEREAVDFTLSLAEERGYKPYNATTKYAAGDKVYLNNRSKAVILCTIGTKPLSDGVRILASHIDSPRLDLKPRPLYEEGQLGYFKTHYYGGIKKYQWSALPLALHGVLVQKDGRSIKVCLGEDPSDPVFCVTDLLPHLAKDQMKRTLQDGIRGEELNLLIGCHPFRDDKASEKVKLNLIKLLNEKYGIIEADFLSADLMAVPAFKARDLGLDRAMVGAYGHDDRVCAYTSLMAELECENPAHTTVLVLADKEETGSDGNTGLASHFLEDFVKDLAASQGLTGRHVLAASTCFSADVNCAFDPTFADVSEKRNTSYINYGVVFTKYTGSGGKYSTSEASAEFMGWVRGLMDENKVLWQTGELGKVDAGGGGTVAKYVAALNVDVIDVGVPVLSMHSPFEVVSKIDTYMAYKAFCAYVK